MLPNAPFLLKRPIAAAAAVGGPAYVYRASYSYGDSSTSNTTSVNIGTASADRLIVVGVTCQGSGTPTVTVNGVTLTQIVINATNQAAIFAGLVTSGSGSQNIVVNWTGSAFQGRGVSVWTITGLSSNSAKQSGSTNSSASGTINISAGDFLFAVGISLSSVEVFTGSTETPVREDNLTTDATFYFTSADWSTLTTNASWSVTSSPDGGPELAFASWR